jgi:serine-type D-Ala-D-Ala carboxypeptidase/endopeptidase
MKKRLLRFAALGAAALLPTLGRAAQKPAPVSRDDVDALVKPYIDGQIFAGAVVGLVDGSTTQIFGYGQTGGTGGSPDADTVFEIGSLSKAFTGMLLARMVEEGKVRLEDPVQKLLPGTVRVPKHGDTEITLLHLATHNSGLPSLPDDFQPKDPENPYADYAVEQMYAFLSGHKLARKPGTRYDYSNLGAGLLGHALSLKAGKSYEELLIDRICKPLGMIDTTIALRPDQRARLARGHSADGSPAANWDLPTLAGAGAIRSTARDLVRLLSACTDREKTQLDSAIRAASTKRSGAGGTQGIGLGWHIDSKSVVWHNGQTGGYHSFAGFHPEQGYGVVILSNTASREVDALADLLLKRLRGEKVEAPKVRVPIQVDPKVLDSYVGDYPLSPDFVIAITRPGAGLALQATGQPRLKLFAESETRFFLREVDAQITFEKDADGKVTGLVLHQNGRDQRAPRSR